MLFNGSLFLQQYQDFNVNVIQFLFSVDYNCLTKRGCIVNPIMYLIVIKSIPAY